MDAGDLCWIAAQAVEFVALGVIAMIGAVSLPRLREEDVVAVREIEAGACSPTNTAPDKSNCASKVICCLASRDSCKQGSKEGRCGWLYPENCTDAMMASYCILSS